MTTTYNVNIIGGLTNTYGVLSGFSASNYATTPRSFTFSSYDWEFNIGFKTGDDISGDQNVVTPLADGADKDAINIWVNSGRILVIICDSNNGQTILLAEIPCSVRTNYYIKCQYINGVYYIKQSSDGITYTNAVTPLTSTTLIWDTNQKWVFGCARGQNRPFYGTIDLNYCYLKINNAIVWRGVTETSQVITHIQLRRDISSTWATINPVLLEGEVGIETDTKKQKIGDGSTPWNGLQYDLGSTALQVSGGTMTGGLNFSNSGQSTISLNGISTSSYADITYKDGSNNRLAHLRAYNDSSTKRRAELVVMNDNGSPAGNGVRVTYENGTESCEFPNTKCADGQPVAVDQLLTTSTAIGSYNIDISSYLPNDSYDYEIILNGEIYNSNSTYGQVWLGSSKSTTIIASNVGTNKRLSTILAPLVVSTNREITMQIAGHAIEWQNVNNRRGLYLVGYRRLGTNS